MPYFFYSRHLFEILDKGKIKWESPQGPMGKELKRLNQNLTPLVDFQRLETNVPPLNENIYTEQQDAVRFHELMKCVANGNVPEKFISRQYPVLSENRWRTCGMRVLGLWIRKNNPSNALTILANFTTKADKRKHR